MAVWTISDLHLSFGADKPMDIFRGWQDYCQKIERNWRELIAPEDTVVLPGDFSWGLKLEETLPDFAFLQSLPGRKLLLKGNHDLWWSTVSKMQKFLDANGIFSASFVHNNCAVADGMAICGTRGWFFDDAQSDKKLILREAGRLDTSIRAGKATGLPLVVFLHYPPVYDTRVCMEIFDVLRSHDIKRVYCGHIHGRRLSRAASCHDGVEFLLVSCDAIAFCPVPVVAG